MKIRKRFERTRFGLETIKAATGLLNEMNTPVTVDDHKKFLEDNSPMSEQLKDMTSWEHEPITDYSITDKDGLEWELDTFDEWLEAYQLGATSGHLSQHKSVYGAGIRLDFDLFDSKTASTLSEPQTMIAVDGRDRETALSLMRPFNMSADVGAMPKPVEAREPVKVFIAHGGASTDWMALSLNLEKVHGVEMEAFEFGPRAGLNITEILQSMLARSSFAIIVLTAEDAVDDGQLRARQNVIHELGLCQGKLGFSKVVPVVQHGVEWLSNLAGTSQVRYMPGNITDASGQIIAAIRREFP